MADETGGLSGQPLFDDATRVLAAFRSELDSAIPLVGVGGITYGEDARRKQAAGAALVQLYSGFIYQGPRLVRDCVEALARV